MQGGKRQRDGFKVVDEGELLDAELPLQSKAVALPIHIRHLKAGFADRAGHGKAGFVGTGFHFIKVVLYGFLQGRKICGA